MSGICWLASYPKSGNTWLRAFIATYLRNPAEPLSINELRFYTYGDGFADQYEIVTGKNRDDLTIEDLRDYRPRVHWMLATNSTDTAFVKTHHYVGFEDGIPLITPDVTVGAIYVMRNPLDVADSYANHYGIAHDDAVDQMCTPDKILPGVHGVKGPDYVGSWNQHVRSWIEAPGLKLHVMRYEDMLHRPGPTFRKLIQFLELPVHTKRLTKAIKFTSFDELNKQEREQDFQERSPKASDQFFRKGQSGHWREILTQDQVDRMVAAHGETMQRFGYLDKKGRPV